MQDYRNPIGLFRCWSNDLLIRGFAQHFRLTWHKKLRLQYVRNTNVNLYLFCFLFFSRKEDCLQNNIHMSFCQYGEGTKYQDWKYDVDTRQLMNYEDKQCLTASMGNVTLLLKACDIKGKHFQGIKI